MFQESGVMNSEVVGKRRKAELVFQFRSSLYFVTGNLSVNKDMTEENTLV
ncbi:hypothetical protein PAXRUDRAFT_19132 [Paxillus rubicundulus Ve08.2h10]|uniref:Uncharacterized protein n=1 Tax=Paxillus rubicundulus Ve08.2h10 TaxID=930991 RepID=A0A0D0CW14_9AGAM|nr:hypothetical protein PAXRUDRAFT_19132 [Paxillus rubicundulus Ve08.2h10]